MKVPKCTSSSSRIKGKAFGKISSLDSHAEDTLEKRLYERVLQSYARHQEKRERRMRVWRSAAIWIGALIFLGGTIWGAASLHPTGTKEDNPLQLFTSTNSAKRIRLSDSTIVILRPHSSLQVAADFNRSERNVILEGNAFFEVRKNKKKPFIVRSKYIETTVLGTRFSVSSPGDGRQHSVFLEEGKVSVWIDEQQHTLVPNERIVYQEDTGEAQIITQKDVNLNMQNGALSLDGVDFATLSECLTDYYGISLVHLTNKAPDTRYKITLTPQMEVTDIAELISIISDRPTQVNEQLITIK